MEAALRRAGFPGERTLDSAEYQAWTRWHEALGELATLERVTGSMGYTEACERLARIAGATLFQPQTPEVPIQVMGLLESVGSGMVPRAQPLSREGIRRQAAPKCQLRRGRVDAWTYFFPVIVEWARRFFCQHSSVDCVQTGTSLP